MSAIIVYDDPESAKSGPLPLGYYRCVEPDRNIEADDYVRVTRVDDGTVHFQQRSQGYGMRLDAFQAHFAYAPEGEAVTNARMIQITEEIAASAAHIDLLQQALATVTPHVGAGASANLEGMAGIAALVPIDDRSPGGFKIALARVRALAQQKQTDLQAKRKELEGILAEKMAAATAMLEPLKQMVEHIEEAIWTVNLYLGRDEEIVRLADGDPAPADTPITIRQAVLAMDEESAAAAENGGIDARSIGEFDRWIVARPEHLEQVLPEPKGVVALVPRWESKDYGDPWVNVAQKKADRETYFLIRNGQRLYRVNVEGYSVGRRLVPTRDEFLEFFFTTETDWTTHERRRVPLEPGSHAYMKATKQADARSRHYLRIGLVLQGLIDRTPVFHPLPGPVQVTQLGSYDHGWVRILADGEYLLGDGHERFENWQARLNSALEPGMRIIGYFGGYSGDYASFRSLNDNRHGHERLSPPNAPLPESNTLYRLEGKREGGWYFLYDRTDEIWNPETWTHHAPKVRASCRIEPDDRFILAFDLATVEEMEYFLRARQDRSRYVTMFPLLKRAIRLKHEEAAAEAPFRSLLIGEIVKAHGVDFADAESEIDDLIRWYKFKNKNHRPLVGDDDGKALRMIVHEFGLRLRERANRTRRRESGEFEQVAWWARHRWPDALLVAHKRKNEYVALLPHNDENVYVEEWTFTPDGVRESKSWRTVDTRHRRWELLHTSERWPAWKINASRWEYLTDEEIRTLAPIARRRTEDAGPGEIDWHRRGDPAAMRILAVCYDRESICFHVYYRAAGAELAPPDQPLTVALHDVTVKNRSFAWTRAAGGDITLLDGGRGGADWGANRPWDAGVYRSDPRNHYSRPQRDRAEWILERDDDAVAQVDAERAAFLAAKQARDALQQHANHVWHALEAAWLAREEQARYAAFLAEYHDPDLWEGHAKTLPKLTYPYVNRFHGGEAERSVDTFTKALVEYAAQRDLDLRGMTVGAARRLVQAPDGFPGDLDDLTLLPISTNEEESDDDGN